MNKIVPGLYIGSIYDSRNQDQLKARGITHILSIHDKDQENLPGYNYLCISVKDNSQANIIEHFRACMHFIHGARLQGGKVLVHCLAGMSRSVTVSTAYLMVITGKHWHDIIAAIQQCRLVARPNTGFKLQLDRYESQNVAQDREWLRSQHGVLDAFGDKSRIEALYHQHMACDERSKTPRQPIRHLAVSSADFFKTSENDDDMPPIEKLHLNGESGEGDVVTLRGSGSRRKERLPLNADEEISWKNVQHYQQNDKDNMMEE